MTDCVQHPETLNVRAPASFENSMSLLNLAIGNLERFGPSSSEDIHRMRLLTSRLDTLTSKAARAVELKQGTGQ